MSREMPPKSPLSVLAAAKLGLAEAALTRDHIHDYQLRKVRETVDWAYRRSPFYRRLLQGVAGAGLDGLDALQRLPFTTAEDLRRQGQHFLCVSQSDVSRVVTLDSSGTTGAAKRLYFTASDQDLTVGFFQYGMAALTAPGDRVLILLPGERPGGIGALLEQALWRLGAVPVPHGVVSDIAGTLAVMAREKVDCLVGIPSQLLALARYGSRVEGRSFRLKNVLLSADHVPAVVAAELRRLWGCAVYEHYGMTEMGLGGGTDCAAHAGYHLHEADFYFEIVDPLTGEAVPEGRRGEVVVTTLTRRGMPLIRYRTGDISRFVPGLCRCGSVLRRLERITQRTDSLITLGEHGAFTMAELDEALFALSGVVDFTARVAAGQKAPTLNIHAWTVAQPGDGFRQALLTALDAVPAVRRARQSGDLTVRVEAASCGGYLPAGPGKRVIRSESS